MSTRIVMIANSIDEVGGAQRVVQVLAAGLASRGHDVTVIGIEPAGERAPHESAAYRVERLLTEPYPKEEGPELDTQRAAAVLRLQSILDDGDPGVVITAQVWAMEHLAQCRTDAWRIIGQFHSSFEAAEFGTDLRRIRRAYADVDLFLALTRADAERFTGAGLDNAAAMPNPIAAWPAQAADPSARRITYLGRLSAEKAPMTLMQAWRIITEQALLPDWSLQVIGTGPHDVQVEAALLDLPRAVLLPPVADPLVALAGTGLLALPSLVEGQPLVVMEALSMGVPVVASDCSAGVRELLDSGRCGVLVNRGDAADLARGIVALAQDDLLREAMGSAGRVHMEQYRLEHVLDRWETVLVQVLR